MRQLVQTLKDGKICVVDVPPPLVGSGMVLVRNSYSLISPGTEGSTVQKAKKGFIGKAKDSPEQVKKSLELLKQFGPLQTYRTVMQKLDAYSSLGYSSAGKVLAVGDDVRGLTPGDAVACGGGNYAVHAEIAAVPVNLCVKLGDEADLRHAAFNTLGAIALQGFRQSELQIGETCLVIGLGLVGQLTCLIARAAGLRVVGLDLDTRLARVARENCADFALARDEPGLEPRILEITAGIGVDAVIITAGTASLDPVNLAGRLARKKGRVVVVGNSPTGFDRDPYYRKELELRMSCSYGPGRYDLNYEEKGVDYPVGYVRWTEKRNMEAFQKLIQSRKIGLEYLITHVFSLADAPRAYDLILTKKEPYLGMLIKYDESESVPAGKIVLATGAPAGKVSVGFIGAGNYAQNFLLPNFPGSRKVNLKGILDANGNVSRRVGEKYGFEYCTSAEEDIFGNPEVNLVYVATRHDSHARYVLKALDSGKNVTVEKPLCLTEAELEEIKEKHDTLSRGSRAPFLMVGYNRRFSELTQRLKRHFGSGPMSMIYRVNSGFIAPESWIHDRGIGGGRILGEVCHFVDYLTYLNGSVPVSVFASTLSAAGDLEDTVAVILKFRNGSIGTIAYYSNGSKALFKEYIEVYRDGSTGIIKDFRELSVSAGGRKEKKRLLTPDKGQKRMIGAILGAVREGLPAPIPFEDVYSAALVGFRIIQSLRAGERLAVAPAPPGPERDAAAMG